MNGREPLITSTKSPSCYGAINYDVIVDEPQHQGASSTDDNDDEHSHQPHPQEPQEKTRSKNVAHEAQTKTPRSRCCGVVCIEIPVFLFFISHSNTQPLVQYYLTDRMHEELGVPNVTDTCSGGSENDAGTALSDRIQDRVASYTMILSLLSSFPAALLALFVGSLSDRFGRKTVLYIVVLGTTTQMAIYSLVYHYHWRLEYLYIGSVIQGLTGNFGSFLMASYAIVADVTKEGGTRRGLKIATTEAVTMIGSSAGKTMAGYWLTATGYLPPMCFSMGLQVVVLLFVAIFIPETATRHRETMPVNCSVLLRSLKLFLQRGRRVFFLVCLFSFFLGVFNMHGNNVIIILYQLAPPFCWSEIHISLYSGGTTLASWVAVLSITACLSSRVADDTFALIGALSGMVGFIFQGLAETDLFAYLAAGTSLLNNMLWPMLRTLMSKKVDAHEQGALFAGIAVIEMLGSTVSSVISPAIYKASLGHVHGLPFLCFAAVDLVIALSLISLIARRKIGGTVNEEQGKIN